MESKKDKPEVDPVEQQIFIARCAEQIQCYDNMIEFLQPIMEEKGTKMSTDERNLITTAFKNSLGPIRKVWQTLLTVETYEKYQKYQPYIEEYKEEIRDRFDSQCMKIIDLIQANMIDKAEQESEPLAYFSKMTWFEISSL